MSDAAAPNPEASTESSLTKRTVANRRNAEKATGPKTPEGKRKSSLNAEKHGLLSKEICAGHDAETRQEYRKLLADLFKTFAPADTMEEMLVERIAVAQLRLARVLRYELRETQRAIKIGGKRLPEHIQEPAVYDFLFDCIREDPEEAANVICKGLATLRICLEHINEDGNLHEAYFDLLRSVPGNLLTRVLAFTTRPPNDSQADLMVSLILASEVVNKEASAPPDHLGTADYKIIQLVLEEQENLLRWHEICFLVRNNPGLRAQLRRPDLPEKEASERILRYGAAAERQFDKALDQLERRQRRRLGETVPPPVNAHLTLEQ